LHRRAESNPTRRDENKTAKRQRGSAVRRIVHGLRIERRATDGQAAKKDNLSYLADVERFATFIVSTKGGKRVK